jgi:hypothetical protein
LDGPTAKFQEVIAHHPTDDTEGIENHRWWNNFEPKELLQGKNFNSCN